MPIPLRSWGLEEQCRSPCVRWALRCVICLKPRRPGCDNINDIHVYTDAQFMRLDITARRNLELFETMRAQEKRGSLLWVLDKTQTAMGKRLLRRWLEQPLISAGGHSPPAQRGGGAGRRHGSLRRDELDRPVGHPRPGAADDPGGLRHGQRQGAAVACLRRCERIPALKEQLHDSHSALLTRALRPDGPAWRTCVALIEVCHCGRAAPDRARGGRHHPRTATTKTVDEYRTDMTDGKGIHRPGGGSASGSAPASKACKVGYNRVFGYYIEVTNVLPGPGARRLHTASRP